MMLAGKRIVVVMPAYNAEHTLERTFREIPGDIVDEILLIDDHSTDGTVQVAKRLGLEVRVHGINKGYGANQKTCYAEALHKGADIVIMLHPDYQYPPRLITAIAGLITSEMFDVVLGSRILGGMALRGGMPHYKYIANRVLTLIENLMLRQKISEYHTGYRGFSRRVLSTLPLLENSDDFVFDNQMLAQAIYFGFRIGEVTAPSRYTAESSSINFRRGIVYGLGVLRTALQFMLQRMGLRQFRIFSRQGKRLLSPHNT